MRHEKPLPHRQHLTLTDVGHRAREFPTLAGLLGDHLALLEQGPIHLEAVPRVLALMGEAGQSTGGLLRALERCVDRFDAVSPEGWLETRRKLASANTRDHFLSLCGELVIASWLEGNGISVIAFEPETPAGTRPDLWVTDGDQRLYLEIVSPSVAASSIDRPNLRLHVELERVQSGLAIDVEGYEARADRLDPDANPARRWGNTEVDAVVREFRRCAAELDPSELPATVIPSEPGQPIQINALSYDPDREGTFVMVTSAQSGLIPDVNRFVNIVRRERRHLADKNGGILVDLTRWGDFRGAADYYLDAVKAGLTKHQMPALVGSFAWQGESFVPVERNVLHVNSAWVRTPFGSAFTELVSAPAP
jgi:hypothetical protein